MSNETESSVEKMKELKKRIGEAKNGGKLKCQNPIKEMPWFSSGQWELINDDDWETKLVIFRKRFVFGII